jgi:hypothetical protein
MTYTCAVCGKQASDPTGWARAQITQTHYTSALPSVGPDDALVVLDFDTDAHRDEWCAKAGLAPPQTPKGTP